MATFDFIRPKAIAVQNDFLGDVGAGLIEGQTATFIDGVSRDVDMGDPFTVWNVPSTNYVFLTADTTLYLSSTSSADTSLAFQTNGLKSGVQNTVIGFTDAVDGQVQNALPDTLGFVYLSFSVNATPPVGEIYLAESTATVGGVPSDLTKVKAKIEIIDNLELAKSTQAIYMVPDGYALIGHHVRPYTGRNRDIQVFVGITFAGLNTIWTTFRIFQQAFDIVFGPRFTLLGGVRLEYRANAENNNSEVTLALDTILRKL